MSEHADPTSSSCPACGATLSRGTGGVCLDCLGREALRASDGEPHASAQESAVGGAGPLAFLAEPSAMPTRIGAYTIIEEIGRGGMGVVYAARHDPLGRIVALKVISAAAHASVEQQTRFLREAQTHAALRHPHIVSVHDAGQDRGYAYFTMDLAADGDLAARLRQAPPGPRLAAQLVAKVARAVAHAHAGGILHRDLKPSNILLEGDEPRVSDFGLAAQLDPGGDLTLGTRALGTPAYLAPEVREGGSARATPASDIFALGAILYELLTGRPPATAQGAPAAGAVIAPRWIASAVPRDLETIAMKCLETAPTARYASASALADDLERFLENRPILARPTPPWVRFGRWCRRRPALAALWFLILAFAVGGTASAVVIARARTEAREQLRLARLAEAEALSLTRTAGRRAAALQAVAASAAVRPSFEARNIAIRALALMDVRLVQSWEIASPTVITTTFSADGSALVARMGNDLVWRDAPVDRERTRLEHDAALPQRGLTGIPALSPDGRTVLMHGAGDVIVRFRWDGAAATRDVLLTGRPFPWPRPLFPYGGDIAFSPDGRFFTAALGEGGFSLHEASDGRELARWAAEHPVNRVRWSADGTLIAAASMRREAGGRVHLIDARTLTTRRSLQLAGSVHEIAWSPEGNYLAASSESLELRVFRAEDGEQLQALPTRGVYIARLAFLGDDATLVTASMESVLRWRNRRTGEEFLHLEGVEPANLHPRDGGQEFLTTNGRNRGLVYRIEQPTGLRRVPVDSDDFAKSSAGPGGVAFSPDGRLVAATGQGVTTVFSVSSGDALARIASKSRREEVTVRFAGDGRSLLVCGTVDGLARYPLVEGERGLTVGSPELLDATPNTYLRDLSDDGRRLVQVAPREGKVFIREAIDPSAAHVNLLATWACPGAYGAAFGPSGREVLINHDDSAHGAQRESLRIWDAASGKVVRILDAPVSADAAWNERHGVAITSNGPERSLLWRTDTWTPGASLPASAQGNFTSFDIAPDGRTVAIATGAGVHLVDVETGATLALLNGGEPFGYANATAFSPDGHVVAAVNGDGQLHLWKLEPLRRALEPLGLNW